MRSNENISDLIYIFIDGEASETEQEILFKALSVDAGLRKEMESAVKVNTAFIIDKKSLNSGADSFNQIMLKLNPELPAAGSFAGNRSFYSQFKNSVFSNIGTSILSVLLFFSLAGLWFFANKYYDAKSNVYKNMVKDVSDKKMPLLSSSEINEEVSENGINRRKANKIISKNDIAYSKPIEFNNSNMTGEISKANIEGSVINISNADQRNNYQKMDETDRISDNLIYPGFEQDIRKYELELSGRLGMFYFPENGLRNDNNPFPDNISIGFNYELNDIYSIGFTYGREYFPIYRVSEDAGKLIYEREQSITWAGAQLGVRLPMTSIIENTNILFGASMAATKFGPYFKIRTGAEYDLPESFTLSCSLEYSNLLHKYKSAVKSASKISLVYGIGFKF